MEGILHLPHNKLEQSVGTKRRHEGAADILMTHSESEAHSNWFINRGQDFKLF